MYSSMTLPALSHTWRKPIVGNDSSSQQIDTPAELLELMTSTVGRADSVVRACDRIQDTVLTWDSAEPAMKSEVLSERIIDLAARCEAVLEPLFAPHTDARSIAAEMQH